MQTTLGAGNHFSLFLEGDTLYASGENVVNQLGIGDTGYDIKAPIKVAVPADIATSIASISVGQIHSALLSEDGDVYTWGIGNRGILGHGDDDTRDVPTKIEALEDIEIIHIEMGSGSSYAVDKQGKLYAWGQNTSGQLGLGDEESRLTPTLVEALADETVIQVSSGIAYTLVLTADGDVYGFGANRDGQLGSPAGLDADGLTIREILSPIKVDGLPNTVVSVTADGRTSFAVTEDGLVYGWGENRYGQMQIGSDNGDGTIHINRDDVLVPTLIEGLPDTVIDVKAGARWVVALTSDGDVFAWGPDDEGPTGGLDGDLSDDSGAYFTPTKIAAWDDLNIVEIATGPNSVIARTDTGAVYSFGSNPDGRLGYAESSTLLDPRRVDFESDPAPFLISITPSDNTRDVAADANFIFTFTEEISANEGKLRFLNRDDAGDVIEIDVTDTRFVKAHGDTVTLRLPEFLTGEARYALEFDTGAFVDADGNAVIGFAAGDTLSYNFTVAAFDNDAAIRDTASKGNDFVRGSDADDVLFGLRGNDLLFGNDGADWLRGGNGNDALYGGAGRDRLSGGQGNDTLDGGLGDDNIVGGRGRDHLLGGDGADKLSGGRGRDTLSAGDGNDVLRGGAGADRFVFQSETGNNIVRDFEHTGRRADQLVIDIAGFNTVSDVQAIARFEHGRTVLQFNDELSIQLNGISDVDFFNINMEVL